MVLPRERTCARAHAFCIPDSRAAPPLRAPQVSPYQMFAPKLLPAVMEKYPFLADPKGVTEHLRVCVFHPL